MATVATHGLCTITVWPANPDERLLTRIRGEFREMPGMRLTEDQAMRLWALDRATCHQALGTLVATHYLVQDDDGQFAMAHSGY